MGKKINDASQIEQPEEEGGRGRGQGSQEDQAARERRQERQAKEAGNAGKEGCRQGNFKISRGHEILGNGVLKSQLHNIIIFCRKRSLAGKSMLRGWLLYKIR